MKHGSVLDNVLHDMTVYFSFKGWLEGQARCRVKVEAFYFRVNTVEYFVFWVSSVLFLEKMIQLRCSRLVS